MQLSDVIRVVSHPLGFTTCGYIQVSKSLKPAGPHGEYLQFAKHQPYNSTALKNSKPHSFIIGHLGHKG